MRIGRPPHNWSITPGQAIAVQKKLASTIRREGEPRNTGLVAGLDAAFTPDKKHCIGGVILVITDLPTIGCAKSRLVGEYREPGPGRGSASPLLHKNELVGIVLRTRDKVKPVFVSVGHEIELDIAVGIILDCAVGFRLPEPTRLADHLVAERKKKILLKS